MAYFYRCPMCGSLQTFADDEDPYCQNPDCFYDPAERKTDALTLGGVRWGDAWPPRREDAATS